MPPATVEPTQPRTREVEQRADELRRANGLDTVPVDPLDLANRLGVPVYLGSFVDDTNIAYLNASTGSPKLLVRDNASPFRKRFAIAHTLGRYLLHPSAQPHLWVRELDLYRLGADDSIVAPAELEFAIEANQFATALLMPEQAVRTIWGELKSVGAMARTFNVSEAAMGMRVASLGLN